MFEAVRDAIVAGTLDAEITYVFSNRDPGDDPVTDSFFELVRSEGITLLTLGSVAFRKAHGGERSRAGETLPAWRSEYDRAVAELVDQYPADLGVLAGYMLIFTAEFADAHPLVNLHPALPGGPIGTYTEVIRELIRTGATESGVMLNVAIPEVDMGPVASFCRYAIVNDTLATASSGMSDDEIESSDVFQAIRAEQIRHEAPFLEASLQAFADRRISLDSIASSGPIDLTADVEARLRGL